MKYITKPAEHRPQGFRHFLFYYNSTYVFLWVPKEGSFHQLNQHKKWKIHIMQPKLISDPYICIIYKN